MNAFFQNIHNYIKLESFFMLILEVKKKSQLITIDKVQYDSIFKKNHISLRYHVHSYDMVDTFPQNLIGFVQGAYSDSYK